MINIWLIIFFTFDYSKNGPPQHYGYSQRRQSGMSNSFLKSNIGSAMKKAANLFNTSFTRPNTLKLLVTFTSVRYESGRDRVKFKDAMNSLKIQGVKSVIFAAKKNKVIEELSLKKSQNVFYLYGYRLKYVVDRLWRYLPKKGWWYVLFVCSKLKLFHRLISKGLFRAIDPLTLIQF